MSKVIVLPTAKAPAMTGTKKFVESEWLYLGLIFSDAEQELYYSFHQIVNDARGEHTARFKRDKTTKHLDKHMEGCVYLIETTDDWVTFRFGSMKMLRMWPDASEAEAIRLASRAAERKASTLKMAGKLASNLDDLNLALKPIRAQYLKTNRLGRICIEALVLDALRRGTIG